MEEQNFCLRWDSYQSSITAVFDHLRRDGKLVDVTLCAEGRRLKAHRIVLAACSPYFRDILSENPCQQIVLFLKDTSAGDLQAIVEFMYRGFVNVAQSQLGSFIKTAEMLQISGLSGEENKTEPTRDRAERSTSSGSSTSSGPAVREAPQAAPPAKRWCRSPVPEPAAGSPTAPFAAAVKVEKLEPAEDNDVILTAALGYVAAYEDGGRLEGAGQAAAGTARPGAAPVPSSRGPGASPGPVANNYSPTASSGDQHPCDICGKVYKYRISLLAHRKHHEGRTACFVCGLTSSTVQNLRQHLRSVHRLATDEVNRRTGLQRVRMTTAESAPLHVRQQQYQQQQQAARWPGPGLRQPAAVQIGAGSQPAAVQGRPPGYRGQSGTLQGQRGEILTQHNAGVQGPAAGVGGVQGPAASGATFREVQGQSDAADTEQATRDDRAAVLAMQPPRGDADASQTPPADSAWGPQSSGGTSAETSPSPDHQTAAAADSPTQTGQADH